VDVLKIITWNDAALGIFLIVIFGILLRIHKMIGDLWGWHAKEDAEGRNWYSRARELQSAIDNLTGVLQEMLKLLRSINSKVDELKDRK